MPDPTPIPTPTSSPISLPPSSQDQPVRPISGRMEIPGSFRSINTPNATVGYTVTLDATADFIVTSVANIKEICVCLVNIGGASASLTTAFQASEDGVNYFAAFFEYLNAEDGVANQVSQLVTSGIIVATKRYRLTVPVAYKFFKLAITYTSGSIKANVYFLPR